MSHLVQNLDFMKGVLGTQSICFKKRAKANQNKKQRLLSGLKVSLIRWLYNWKQWRLQIHISIFLCAKSVQEILKETSNVFEIRKYILSNFVHILLN